MLLSAVLLLWVGLWHFSKRAAVDGKTISALERKQLKSLRELASKTK